MKAVIWLSCALISALIEVFIIGDGLSGAILSGLLLGLTIYTAGTLCRLWEKHRGSDRDKR